MIELSTPKELIQNMVLLIEDERKYQNIQQKELAYKANIPLPTYRDFIYKYKISFESLLKLLIALKLFNNISSLLKKRKFATIEEIKNQNNLPKRIVK